MPTDALPFISVVVPVYNEEAVLPKFLSVMTNALNQVDPNFEIIFAADPCTDGTFEIIRQANQKDSRIKLLALSRRFGQPAATTAGLAFSRGQVVVVIDVDLQDPPSLIPEMVKHWREGYKVVIPQRRSRAGENILKKTIAYTGYWFINKVSNVKIPRNTGDFRLMDRRVVNELVKLNESHGFLRGLVAVVGFKTHLLPFDREARDAGEGKYNRITGSLRIGFNGIVAFSDYLLRLMVIGGFSIAAFSIVAIIVVLVMKIIIQWKFERRSIDNDSDSFHLRRADDQHGNSGRVHRPDLRRGQAAAEVHRRSSRGVQWRIPATPGGRCLMRGERRKARGEEGARLC